MTSSVDSRISQKRYESLLSEIEEEDQNIKSELYELSVYDHILQISPGKTIQDEEIKDLVYCYVYAVKNDKVVQKLGVYERFTKEKEPFFDLSTFEKGTLCLFEKYETNPSLFLEFKSDPDAPKTETIKKSKKKSKVEPEVEPEAETKAVEVNLNAPESKPSTPGLLDVSELEGNLGITSEAETKVDSEPKKTKSKIKMKPSKIESKAESKPEKSEKSKPRTKKTKPLGTEVLGTQFG